MLLADVVQRRLRAITVATVAIVLSCALVLANVNLDRMEQLALRRYGPHTADTVVRWRTDVEVWGENDYWATPLESMARREGDCEDFSIAKYMTLLLAGVDVGKMRITYVKAQIGGACSNATEAHMVLAYYPTPSADPLILDNMIDEVRPASRRPDLTPVFGFNSQGLWVGGAAAPATRDPGARLSRWRDVLQRMAADGLG